MMVNKDEYIKEGFKFNMLTIVGVKTYKQIYSGDKVQKWIGDKITCLCECGNLIEVPAWCIPRIKKYKEDSVEFVSDAIKQCNISCGCHKEINLTGKIINNFKVYKIHKVKSVWREDNSYDIECIECGEVFTNVTPTKVFQMKCKCVKKNKKQYVADRVNFEKHKELFENRYASYSLFKRWYNMHQRCYNENNKAFKYYGERGIKISEKWYRTQEGFDNFVKWSIENGYFYTDNGRDCEIDRIDCDGWYSPDNCRYISHKENMNNRHKYGYLNDINIITN